jgi:hypothetical protein
MTQLALNGEYSDVLQPVSVKFTTSSGHSLCPTCYLCSVLPSVNTSVHVLLSAVLQVQNINLAGLDRVIVVFAAGDTDKSLLLRQYSIAFKRSGTKVRTWAAESCMD